MNSTSKRYSAKISLLYIINFYGSPPLNYFEKFCETHKINLTIIKLPSVRSSLGRLIVDSFIKESNGKIHTITFNIPYPLPYFTLFIFQYIVNLVICFVHLRRVKNVSFNIVIGETNFGSAIAYLIKIFKKIKLSVFFNGDILPNTHSSTACFYLPNVSSRFNKIFKLIDNLIVAIQQVLRKIGYRNDLVWYANAKIKKWDEKQGFLSQDNIIFDPILIDYQEYQKYSKTKKNLNLLGYIGRIDDYVGLDIIIPSLRYIRKKIPKILLHIIGGTNITAEKYKKLAIQHAVETRIVFHEYVPKKSDAYKLLAPCALGMCLYKPVAHNVSMIAQPAKPKEYINVGLPIVVTRNGPKSGKEIVDFGAGVTSSFDIVSLSEIIIKTLTNKKKYETLRSHVKKYAQMNHYEKKYTYFWSILMAKITHD